jgi:hypothetical protein
LELHAELPVGVADRQQLARGPVAGAVDDSVDATPAHERRVHQALQIGRLAAARDADTAEFGRQRRALARRRQDRHLTALGGEMARCSGADAAAGGGKQGHAIGHRLLRGRQRRAPARAAEAAGAGAPAVLRLKPLPNTTGSGRRAPGARPRAPVPRKPSRLKAFHSKAVTGLWKVTRPVWAWIALISTLKPRACSVSTACSKGARS